MKNILIANIFFFRQVCNCKMALNWFANILVHHPCMVLISVIVFSGSCLIIPLSLRILPNFSDPQMVL